MEELNDRFARAVNYVRSQRKIGIEMGLAISNAAKEYEVDMTELAREIAKLASEAKAASIKAREEKRKSNFAKWQARDDKKYGWMNN